MHSERHRGTHVRCTPSLAWQTPGTHALAIKATPRGGEGGRIAQLRTKTAVLETGAGALTLAHEAPSPSAGGITASGDPSGTAVTVGNGATLEPGTTVLYQFKLASTTALSSVRVRLLNSSDALLHSGAFTSGPVDMDDTSAPPRHHLSPHAPSRRRQPRRQS